MNETFDISTVSEVDIGRDVFKLGLEMIVTCWITVVELGFGRTAGL